MNIPHLPTIGANWQGGGALAFVAGIAATLLWDSAKRSKLSSVIYQCAYDATKEFYRLADAIMGDPATPVSVHDMIHDMTFFVTEDGHGRRMYEHISEALNTPSKPKDSELLRELSGLSKHRLDLYEKVGEAVAIWIFCMAAVHGHSDLKVTTTMVGATDRPRLFRAAERLLAWLRQGDDDSIGSGGHRALAGRS